MAEERGFDVQHGIVDCLWVIGEPIFMFKEAVEKQTGILAEVDTYQLDYLTAHERRMRCLQPLPWPAEHWQD